MTREEAIHIVQECRQYLMSGNPIWDIQTIDEAFRMAIEALQAEPNKAVPPSLADVYKWERDIALSQLEEYGIGFAEKKRDDLVEVVRCKGCKHGEEDYPQRIREQMDKRWKDTPQTYSCKHSTYSHDGEFFCGYGERREE